MICALCRLHEVCLTACARCDVRRADTTNDHPTAPCCNRGISRDFHLHTSKQHTQEHHVSMCCCWNTLEHAMISASDQKKPVSPMQQCRLLRVRGMAARRFLHVLWLTVVQAPCCASQRQGSLHAAMAATRTVSWRRMCAWLSKGRLGRWKR